ncbi:MAG: hypothetical protein GX471_02190 [Candidatus Microthrix parvicella]|nr:hypothetical protein [Candidatus Microthrix parvicella]
MTAHLRLLVPSPMRSTTHTGGEVLGPKGQEVPIMALAGERVERTFVAIAHGHRMALEQASHNNNASTFRHYALNAIKTLEKWAPTLDELEAMVCAMTPEEAKACRKRAGLPEVKS